jgi:signal transduction histidine kinase
MRLWSPRSISARLTRMNLVVSGAALMMAYISFMAYDLYTLRQNLLETLNTEATIIGSNSVTALLFDDPQAAQTTLSALAGSPHIRAAAMFDPDGKLFASYSRTGMAIPQPPGLTAGQESGSWIEGTDILLGRKVMLGGKNVGSVYLLAATTDLAHRAREYGLLSAAILVLCFLVALLATTTVRNLITEPLTNLADIAGIVTRQKDYTVRATPLQTDDELAFLVRSFNEMLEQIQQREKALEDSRAELEHRVEERTSELLSANKELEAFSYSVAHDLRGPLQHISNIGYLLQQTAAAKGEQGAALIGMLFEGSRRMSQLIDDLLNLSRATSTPVHRTPIDLSSMARTIVDRLRTDEPQRQVEIVIAQGAHMIADEGLMMVVMENLLRNAWKYTSHSERARIEFGFNDRDAETVYFVRDNGVGFNPRYADRLFRPFQRLHSQEDFPGTGVGLATVARIIERHSGRIWAESEVGHGATFFFTVPYESRD